MITTEEEMTNVSNIWQFELRRGNNHDPREGACLLDAVSWFEYGTLGDHPPCVCPVIAAFGRSINDTLSHKGRQRLKSYIPRLSGTVDPAAEVKRAEYLAWQAIRVFAPLVLDVQGLAVKAQKLRVFQGTLQEASYAAEHIVSYYEGYSAYTAVTYASRAAYATYAAYADHAEYAANNAASCADSFVCFAYEDAMIAALDGVLKIGKQADTI